MFQLAGEAQGLPEYKFEREPDDDGTRYKFPVYFNVGCALNAQRFGENKT
jgi:hypothetical protein